MVYKSLNEVAPENLGNIFYELSDVHTRVLAIRNAILQCQR